MKITTKIALGLLTLGGAPMALAALGVGGTAPDFSARASLAGKPFDFKLKDALKKGPVVVYFYPSAYTGGCNLQAHTFAVNHEKFAAAKADRHRRLARQHRPPEQFLGRPRILRRQGAGRLRPGRQDREVLRPRRPRRQGRMQGHAGQRHRPWLRRTHHVHREAGRQGRGDHQRREAGRDVQQSLVEVQKLAHANH